MKKTIIALLALSSMAFGDVLVNVMQNSSGSTAWGADEDISLSNISSTISITSSSGNAPAATNYSNSVLTAGTNVGNGGKYTYTLTFTTSFADNATVILDSLTIDMFSLNGNGATQNAAAAKTCKYTYSLTGGGTDITTDIFTNVDLMGSATQFADSSTPAYTFQDGVYVATPIGSGTGSVSGAKTTISFGDGGVALQKGTQYTFEMNVERVTQTGFYTGIGNVALTGSIENPPVPEPTTGSLSLLALAGLCARRRKK